MSIYASTEDPMKISGFEGIPGFVTMYCRIVFPSSGMLGGWWLRGSERGDDGMLPHPALTCFAAKLTRLWYACSVCTCNHRRRPGEKFWILPWRLHQNLEGRSVWLVVARLSPSIETTGGLRSRLHRVPQTSECLALQRDSVPFRSSTWWLQ